MKVIVRNDTDQAHKLGNIFHPQYRPEGVSIEFDMVYPPDDEEQNYVNIKPLKNSKGEYVIMQALQTIKYKHEVWIGVPNPYGTNEDIYNNGITYNKHIYSNIVEMDVLPFSHFELTIENRKYETGI